MTTCPNPTVGVSAPIFRPREYLRTPSTCPVQVNCGSLGMTAMTEQRTAAVASVTDSFIDLQRTVRRSKARLLAAAGNDVESATHLLLHTVESEGPMRASTLAASAHADLSTISRPISATAGPACWR